MLSTQMIDRLNAQINLEQFSSNLYMQMSAWCEHKGYMGAGSFLKVHASEELAHMHKLFSFVCETGALAKLGSIAAPPENYASLAEVFEKIFEHEQKVTQSINSLVAAAFEEKDFATFQFLQWYVSEQHEEEHLFQGILDKIRIIGTEGKGIYFLDKEIGKLAKAL
jgi:ferritin